MTTARGIAGALIDMDLLNNLASTMPQSMRALYWTYIRHGSQHRRDAMALQILAPLSTRYTPWTKYSMRPSGVVMILDDVCQNDRRQIVECGAGTSTLYLARLLRDRGGHVSAIEHDERWASKMRDAIDSEGLASHASILVVPLERDPVAQPTGAWYSQEHLDEALEDVKIDMLVVDGPIATPTHPCVRYPALPYFRPSLAADCTVVVDDILRDGESEIVKRWEREFGLDFLRRPLNGAVALAHLVDTLSVPCAARF